MNILLPDSGTIEVLGKRDSGAARDQVAYLPEERGLYKKMKVRALLRYYGLLKGADRARIGASVDNWLERIGLRDWGDKPIEALSKGMSQKVQFLAAVVAEPEVVILDEPFSGLDPVNAEVLREAILSLRKAGTTVVFSTHDMATAETMCDRIFMIFKGRKVLDGSLAEIQAAHGHDVIRVRVAGGRETLAGLPGVELLREQAGLHELRYAGEPQALLRGLVAQTAVQHFEVGRPSLHEIFLRIARPAAPTGDVSTGSAHV